MGWVYVLHTEKKIGRPQSPDERAEHELPPRKGEYKAHAQHYSGKAKKLLARLDKHYFRPDARFMQVVRDNGIDFAVGYYEETDDPEGREQEIKRQKNNKRFCRICKGEIPFEPYIPGSGTLPALEPAV